MDPTKIDWTINETIRFTNPASKDSVSTKQYSANLPKDAVGITTKRPYSATWRDPTPYSAGRIRVYRRTGTTNRTYPKGQPRKSETAVSTFTGVAINPSILPSSAISRYGVLIWQPRDLSIAENRAIRRISDKKVEFGEYLLESRKTLGMIATRAGQMARLALALRKGRWNEARKLLGLQGKHVSSSKRWADNYLEYSFGWAPIANDIYNSQSTLRALLKKKQQFRVFAEERSYHPFDRTTEPPASAGGVWSTDQLEMKTRVTLWGEPKSSFLSVLGVLGVDNPVSVLWNTVPFSFVVDWILPVGDLLDATTAPTGTTFLGGTRSLHLTGRALMHWVGSVGSSTRSGSQLFGIEPEYYDRKVYTSYPSGMPMYIKNPFSLGKSVTALALVKQLS